MQDKEYYRDLEQRFTRHELSREKRASIEEIRDCAKNFAYLIAMTVPDGREKSLAITKIEEAVMWANKGISQQKE